MWGGESFMRAPGGGHLGSKSAPCSPVKPFQKRAPAQPDSFHVIHKVPLGDSPYVKAKHVQLVDKDPDAAIALFWAAINAGDRVDSALKDMAIVMKQQNRPEEAIEAIKSLRYRCSDAAQESLDNVLLDLYKRCGRLDDQIALLKHKLHLIHQGMAFNGKRTKTARSQGKKFQVSIEQEATRLLGNLGWAYMQQSNFLAAEAVYRKALSIGPDNNKVCNLGICLMKQGRMEEAKTMLQSVVPACPDTRWGSDSHLKSYERAQEMLVELEASMGPSSAVSSPLSSSLASNNLLQSALWQPQATVTSHQSTRLAEAKSESCVDYAMPFSGALSATAGFGPSVPSRSLQKKMAASLGQSKPPQDRPNSHDMGVAANQFMSYQNSSFKSGWDDYEPGYTSPDENVDTNVRGVGSLKYGQRFSTSSHFQQQQMNWPGEALRQKQETFSAVVSVSNNENQPLVSRKLERSLTLGGAIQRHSNAFNNNNTLGSFPFAQMRRAASENISGKISSSPTKASQGERTPLTYDRTNSVNMYTAPENMYTAPEDDNGASNQITSGWGKMAEPPIKSPLGNSELSFFSRWGYNESRPTVRRSLSLESFDTQLEQIALENEEADEVISILPLHAGTHVKRPRNHTSVKEKSSSSSSSSSSMWNSMGFTGGLGHAHNDDEMKQHLSSLVNHVVSEAAAAPLSQPEHVHITVPAERLSSTAPCSASAAADDAEIIKRQRRLRVFQEITLFPGSPRQVGV